MSRSDRLPEEGLPETPWEWIKEARDNGLIVNDEPKDISNLADYKISGSTMTYPSFLLLRSTWQEKYAKEFVSSHYIPQAYTDVARDFLNKQRSWQSYLQRIQDSQSASAKRPISDIGAFTLVHTHQTEVHRFTNPNDTECETPKVFGSSRKRANQPDNQFSSPAYIRALPPPDPFSSSVSKTNKPPPANKTKRGLFEDPAPSRSTRHGTIDSRMERLTLEEGSPESKGKGKQPITPEPLSLQSLSSAETVSPLDPAFTPPAADEQEVNTALVLLLNTTSMFHEHVRADWTGQRRAFHISTLLEARTDGFLRHDVQDTPMAILEVKSYVRSHKQPYIQMQETAQMASWIAQYPKQGELPALKGTSR